MRAIIGDREDEYIIIVTEAEPFAVVKADLESEREVLTNIINSQELITDAQLLQWAKDNWHLTPTAMNIAERKTRVAEIDDVLQAISEAE